MTSSRRPEPADDEEPLTVVHRLVRRRIHRLAGKSVADPLTPEDWGAYFEHHVSARAGARLFRALPGSPRCRLCGAPFSGPGSRLLRPLGYRPSRKNPHLCRTCIEFSPPGGTTMDVGVLFADVRGFTELAEQTDDQELSVLLRRLYAAAQEVLFPEALIDKLIGDEVMALYIPAFGRLPDPPRMMLHHATDLLARVGYGSAEDRSSSWESAWTSVPRSSATSASAGCTTSPPSAMSSTPLRACSPRRVAARS